MLRCTSTKLRWHLYALHISCFISRFTSNNAIFRILQVFSIVETKKDRVLFNLWGILNKWSLGPWTSFLCSGDTKLRQEPSFLTYAFQPEIVKLWKWKWIQIKHLALRDNNDKIACLQNATNKEQCRKVGLLQKFTILTLPRRRRFSSGILKAWNPCEQKQQLPIFANKNKMVSSSASPPCFDADINSPMGTAWESLKKFKMIFLHPLFVLILIFTRAVEKTQPD